MPRRARDFGSAAGAVPLGQSRRALRWPHFRSDAVPACSCDSQRPAPMASSPPRPWAMTINRYVEERQAMIGVTERGNLRPGRPGQRAPARSHARCRRPEVRTAVVSPARQSAIWPAGEKKAHSRSYGPNGPQAEMMMMSKTKALEERSVGQAIWRGTLCRCPHCGKARCSVPISRWLSSATSAARSCPIIAPMTSRPISPS